MIDMQEPARARILLGLTIVLIGVAILLDQNDGWGIRLDVGWWPFVLIFIGVVRMVWPHECDGRRRSRRGGFWFLAVGVWGLIVETRLFGLDFRTSWPLLVIALGINIVWRSMETPPRRRIQEQ